ncbi:hypothetical protein [Streptomyces sp. CT34]|uniref:hypothetical protein n=1 Tax=Streptomyces sp. CT34 TaxID=1553907 RepID=UPI000AF1CB79
MDKVGAVRRHRSARPRSSGVRGCGTGRTSWGINWDKADCGYGITQITDGMRVRGKEKPEEGPLTTLQQQAAALDYTANIAAGVNILADKWNVTHKDGLTVNGGNPKYLESWFFALWAYNSGYYPKAEADKNGGKWGVGFTNNPANPLWKANRLPFLKSPSGGDSYKDAAHPQDWPYQEKVLGWAARPLEALESPGTMVHGFRAALVDQQPRAHGSQAAREPVLYQGQRVRSQQDRTERQERTGPGRLHPRRPEMLVEQTGQVEGLRQGRLRQRTAPVQRHVQGRRRWHRLPAQRVPRCATGPPRRRAPGWRRC